MSDRVLQAIRSGLLAVVIGIVGALALAHFAACEQSDSFCAFTGSDSK
jgi:hypothetical protein